MLAVRSVDVMDHSIQKRPIFQTMRWVYKHSRRLVDDDQIRVFVDDVDWNILSQHRVFAGQVDSDLDEISGKQSLSAILVPTVDLTIGGLYDLAQVHLAQRRKSRTQQILEPHLALVFSNGDLDPARHTSILSHAKKWCSS